MKVKQTKMRVNESQFMLEWYIESILRTFAKKDEWITIAPDCEEVCMDEDDEEIEEYEGKIAEQTLTETLGEHRLSITWRFHGWVANGYFEWNEAMVDAHLYEGEKEIGVAGKPFAVLAFLQIIQYERIRDHAVSLNNYFQSEEYFKKSFSEGSSEENIRRFVENNTKDTEIVVAKYNAKINAIREVLK